MASRTGKIRRQQGLRHVLLDLLGEGRRGALGQSFAHRLHGGASVVDEGRSSIDERAPGPHNREIGLHVFTPVDYRREELRVQSTHPG